MKEIKICPFCEGRLRGFWSKPSFSKCISCELVIANQFPDPEDLNKLYETPWEDRSRNTHQTGGMDGGLAHQYILELFSQTDVPNLERGLRILDFGAGRGALMRELEKQGKVEVYGVDPYTSQELVREGLKAYPNLENIPKDVLFDGIITMDVVEHLRAPWVAFRNLRQRLKPGGWFCISTPNPNSLNARISGAKWREAQRPGNILFMSGATLIKMLESAGYSHFRSLKWKVRYGDSVSRDIVRNVLQNFALGGAVRMIAFNPCQTI